MNIHEVLEYGSIVASNEELDLLITVNGAYFNLWVGGGYGEETDYTNTEAFDMSSRVEGADPQSSRGLYGLDIVKVMDAAEALLAEVLAGEDEEE
jgi:hypothetical protein